MEYRPNDIAYSTDLSSYSFDCVWCGESITVDVGQDRSRWDAMVHLLHHAMKIWHFGITGSEKATGATA